MKSFKIVSAGLILGAALFTGCSQKEEPAKELKAVVYTDEYNYVLYKVEIVNDKGEVFAEALDGAEGLYLDNNRINAEAGDIVRGIFDAADWEFIAAEKVTE